MIDLHAAKSMAEMVPDDVVQWVGYLLIVGGSLYAGKCISRIVTLVFLEKRDGQ